MASSLTSSVTHECAILHWNQNILQHQECFISASSTPLLLTFIHWEWGTFSEGTVLLTVRFSTAPLPYPQSCPRGMMNEWELKNCSDAGEKFRCYSMTMGGQERGTRKAEVHLRWGMDEGYLFLIHTQAPNSELYPYCLCVLKKKQTNLLYRTFVPPTDYTYRRHHRIGGRGMLYWLTLLEIFKSWATKSCTHLASLECPWLRTS